jgi:hypothetical protein
MPDEASRNTPTVRRYFCAGKTPEWQHYVGKLSFHVVDLKTSEEYLNVDEVDADAGWLVRAKLNAQGEVYVIPGTVEIARERLEGLSITIKVREVGKPGWRDWQPTNEIDGLPTELRTLEEVDRDLVPNGRS